MLTQCQMWGQIRDEEKERELREVEDVRHCTCLWLKECNRVGRDATTAGSLKERDHMKKHTM